MTNPMEKLINKIKCMRKKTGFGFLVSVSVLLLALAMGSVSWFTAQISLSGSSMTTGSIKFAAAGYDAEANLVTTILPEGESSSDPTWRQPLFKTDGLAVGDAYTAFLVLENKGSLATDYAISFSASGQVEYLGGYWYAMTDITSQVPSEGSNSEKLQTYKNSHPTGVTEEDSNANNMVTMERYSTRASFAKGDLGKRYYRLDYGMKKSAVTTDYTGKTIQIATKIYAAQAGHLEDSAGGYIYAVSTVQELDKAIKEALPGDTIQLKQNIIYNGDIVFNRAVNITTGSYTLTVNGNLIYSYAAANDLVITTTGGGSIRVLSPKLGVGGNFTISVPNSNVQINGSASGVTDIAVSQKLSVNTTRAFGAGGLTLSGCRISNAATGALATVYLDSDTRVTVTAGTTIGILRANVKTSNIDVDNNGTISQIILTDMYLLAQTGSPQIYILNAGSIKNTILLPSWSVRFEGSGTGATGNTKIVKAYTGSGMTVGGSDNFSNQDIISETSDVIVEQITPGNDDALRVYYQNLEENGAVKKTTLQELLTDYFNRQGYASASAGIQRIIELEIISVEEKALDATDFAYMKSSSMGGLKILNMERARVYDTSRGAANCLPDRALENATKLTEVILPNTLVSMQSYALNNLSGLQSILVIPASVDTYYGTAVICSNIPYLEFSNPNPAANLKTVVNSTTIKIIFTPEANLNAYKAIFTDEKVFQQAQMADDKQHFVKDLGSGGWEIVCYGGTGKQNTRIVIGEDIYLDGIKLTVVKVGKNAYRNRLTEKDQTIGFSDSITEIGDGAFYNCTGIVGKLSFPQNMQSIGFEGFYQCSGIAAVDTGGIKSLDNLVFGNCVGLVEANLPEAETIGVTTNTNSSFGGCTKLVSVQMPKAVNLKGPVFGNCSALAEVYLGGSRQFNIDISGSLSVFSGAGSAKIYVPLEAVEFYKGTTYPGNAQIPAERVFPAGEKNGTLEINGVNIGQFITLDNEDGTAVLVTGNEAAYVGNVTLPGEDKHGNRIVEIYENAYYKRNFSQCSLTVPENIVRINDRAFYLSTGIVSVSMPGTVTVGASAFQGCSGLVSVYMPKVETIKTYAFYQNSNLLSLDGPNLLAVGSYAFQHCTSLVYVDTPGVTTVATDGFAFCTKLVSVKLGSVERLDYEAFNGCSSLRELYFGERDTPLTSSQLGISWINGTPAKLKYFVPANSYDKYTTALSAGKVYEQGEKAGELLVNGYNIGQYIMSDTGSGTAKINTYNLDISGDYIVPDEWNGKTITSLGRNAFRNTTFTNCNLTMPNLLEIGSAAFNLRTGILSINMPEVTTIGGSSFEGLKDLISVSMPNAVTIGPSAFKDCSNLQTLDLKNVESIGEYAFAGAKSLIHLELPEVTALAEGGHNFSDCTKLVSLSIPKVQSLPTWVFYNCTSLREIYFGDRDAVMTSGQLGAFWSNNTPSTLKYYVPAGSYDKYTTALGGVTKVFEQGEKAGELLVNGYDIGQYMIGDTGGETAKINTCNLNFTGDYTVPEKMNGKTITAIEKHAFRTSTFRNCNLFIPGVKDVGEAAFYGRSGITSVSMPEAVTMGVSVFENSTDLVNASMPKLVSMGSLAFKGCSNLLTVNMERAEIIGYSAFQNDGSLTIANMPNLTLMNGGNIFSSCTNLVSVYMPKVKNIPTYTFSYCSSLREISFGDRDTTLTAADLGNGWNIATHPKLKYYVPAGSYDKYTGVLGATKVFPQGEKAGELLVNGCDIGQYIISDTGGGTAKIITCNLSITGDYTVPEEMNGKAVTAIDKQAFRMTSFTNCNLTIPGVEDIGNSAFETCLGLLSVNMPKAVTLGSRAFYGSTDLVTASLPNAVKIGGGAFQTCSKLASVDLSKAENIGSYALSADVSLVSVNLPEATFMDPTGSVFEGCTKLVSVSIPKLTSLPQRTFGYCSSLREIYFGDRDTAMLAADLGSNWAVSVSSAVKYYIPESSSDKYGVLDATRRFTSGEKAGEFLVNGFNIGEYIISGNGDHTAQLVTCNRNITGSYTVPDILNEKTITTIGHHAFYRTAFNNCELTIPQSVSSVGSSAFEGRTGINSVTGSGIVTMGQSVFNLCTDLQSVVLPRLTTAEDTVFNGCSALETIYFEDIIRFGKNAMAGCSSLKTITFNKVITSTDQVPSYDATAIPAVKFLVYVPYTSLPYYANGLWAGKTVTSYNQSFTEGSRTYVVNDVAGGYELAYFQDTQVCQELVLPEVLGEENLVGIAPGAFAGVGTSLMDITLSRNVMRLSSGVLSECTVLQNIYVASGNEYYIDKEGVLYNTDGKMLILYPCGRDSAGYKVDDDTVAIASGAFTNVAGLQSITLGSSLGVIDSGAFKGCAAVDTVIFTGVRPPILSGTGIFDTSVEGFQMVITVDAAVSAIEEEWESEELTSGLADASQSNATATPGNADSKTGEQPDIMIRRASRQPAADVLASYLCAYNFEEYVPYMKASIDMEMPDVSGMTKNQLPWPNVSDVPLTRQHMLLPDESELVKKEEETAGLPETLPTEGGDGDDPKPEESESGKEEELKPEESRPSSSDNSHGGSQTDTDKDESSDSELNGNTEVPNGDSSTETNIGTAAEPTTGTNAGTATESTTGTNPETSTGTGSVTNTEAGIVPSTPPMPKQVLIQRMYHRNNRRKPLSRGKNLQVPAAIVCLIVFIFKAQSKRSTAIYTVLRFDFSNFSGSHSFLVHSNKIPKRLSGCFCKRSFARFWKDCPKAL